MYQIQSTSLMVALLAATKVIAHGHVTNVVVNGAYYEGFDIGSFPYMEDPPKVAAWTTPNTGNGFIAPDQFGSPDIICHQNATNAQAHIPIKAGDRVSIQWSEWPESHHGPVIDYLARCEEDCATVDKTSLEFFKIDGVGLVDDADVPGLWGDDQLIKNNNSWIVEIPQSIAPGNYVLRHELIALHGAQAEGGAQSYPQCFNLQVTSSGTDQPAGVVGTELYTPDAPGILANIYSAISSYPVPGPTMYSGAVSITQASSAVTSTATAVAGSASANNAAAAVVTSRVSTIPVQIPSTFQTRSRTMTPSVTPTPSSSGVASSSATPSASAGPGGQQKLYGQCGGQGWVGPSHCGQGASCHIHNAYYHQCVPGRG
ncbi:hypothetical protein FE257_001971 [Aspergillus nanangensis]|uniref:AA9 family lytic polysaccharide monooxygenase n=1 Tax=Aspergillus nanangensis TaxID=2582783 RepID=A0AAD4CD30_ASPNN|nr:hypothetical protein FE257_001971 [Aspergillus nanangensis]